MSTQTHKIPAVSNNLNKKNTDYVSAIYFRINPEFKIQLDENNFVVNLECLNDDAKNIFCDINVVGMKGITAIDVLLTTVFSSGVVKEDVTVYVSPYYQKENDLASQLVKEIPALVLDIKEKVNYSNEVSVELTDSNSENTVSKQQESESKTETGSQSNQQSQTKPHKQNVLCRADFDVPDVHGTGYTNLIDYYNAFPNGKGGGTFANAGLMIHYREDLDKDMSLTDSLAFRTYRGIGLGSGKNEVFTAYGTGAIQAPFPEIMGISDAQHIVSSFVEYRARIASGACVGIRFYFDQNDTVMWLEYSAVYLKYAGNISDSTLYPLEN